MALPIRREEGGFATRSADLAVARIGMRVNRMGRDQFLGRQLGPGETFAYLLIPSAISERLVPGLREYNAYEANDKRREGIEKRIAAEQKATEKAARLERKNLFERPFVPAGELHTTPARISDELARSVVGLERANKRS